LTLVLCACAGPTATVSYPEIQAELVEMSTPTASPEPTETPVPEGVLSPVDLVAFDFVIEKKIEAIPLAGLTLGIRWGENPIYVKGYGSANLEESTPAETTTIYSIASLTKQFMAAAILKLVEERGLDLAAPIGQYLPSAPETWSGVTLHHLLSHTSGLPDYDQLSLWPTAESLVSTMAELPLLSEPGSQFRYGGTGYDLLCQILKAQTGQACDRYLQEQFFDPLGLESTFNCSQRFEGIAQGYQIVARELQPVLRSPTSLFGASGLCSTAPDLLHWQQALIDGRAISAESYRTMTTPSRLSDGTLIPYGYGLGVGDVAIGHGGQDTGFRSWLVYYPDDDLGIVLLSNTDIPVGYDLDGLASVIADRIRGKSNP
jgi:CubicO group peptidase (beta-lactamase class C family)